MTDTIETKYGAEEAAWLRAELAAFWAKAEDEFDCVDNSRLCLVGDALDEAAYDEAASQGCCGFVDLEVGPSPAGRTYRHGFNHGH